MDRQQAEIHLKILKSRVNALAGELDAALNNNKSMDERIETLKNGLSVIYSNRQERIKEVECKYEADIADHNRQIKLAEDMLVKKKEEREALLGYLSGLNLMDSISGCDFREFDWDSLQRAAENLHKPKEELINQHKKAEALNDYVQRARAVLGELNNQFTATALIKERLTKAHEGVKVQSKEWQKIRDEQEKRINKLLGNNERLNILIKQCIATNEPISEYLTKNVQAKCQSFLNSETSTELLNGLLKFKTRQQRIIKLLQYKDNQLGSETNKLEVARDQTHDQLSFYQNLIESRRRVSLTNIMSSNCNNAPQQAPATGA